MIVIELFLAFIFYNYYKLEEEHLSEQLFLEMKNYSFFFDDDRFDIDIVPKSTKHRLYELYFDKENLYILAPLTEEEGDVLKIFYLQSEYQKLLNAIKIMMVWQFIWLTLIAMAISLLFALYALHPLRNALLLLEEFIKDIIHDLNTPISSILINLKMMEGNSEEVERITQSAKTISMLHKNLDSYLKESKFIQEEVDLKAITQEQVNFFASMYDYLKWEVELESVILFSNKNALSRIIYNLLSNACKYNKSEGFVKVTLKEHTLTITNSSYGIKNPKKIFNRFYKESDRGLGIGLHIVQKLVDELEIRKQLEVKENMVTITLGFS